MPDVTRPLEMNDLPDASPRIAVIGGGMAGLAAAHRLSELAPALA